MTKQKIYIVAGPTASGKSARALDLAQQHDGVIINCDSLQIYDGLPTLTAQPDAADLASAPHKLYAHLHPNDVTSAGNWRELVEPLIHDVLATGKTPIICGGTGLYIKALTQGLSPIPDVPDAVREQVVQRYQEMGPHEFYAELQRRDPEMAARFHVNHKARIIRAMEVLEATGQSLAQWQKSKRARPPDDWRFVTEIIMPVREELYRRCNTRFEAMIEQGALDEVKAFAARLDKGEVNEGVPLTKALGFDFLRRYLEGGISLDEAIMLSQGQTRRYAKRQSTWFRNQM
ncbi:MAG: tRNA (adenosine(37)-N6)-dimethylallyltransferase MiaA [Micavibrio sp.]|nr:tRNA (adenosine(37)-N6)-dimethylallyltransferase MiaA [Micavibrio sp.]|tara:strand:+ start:2806 stop:3672 length:867 start_codon:yes stop_codon:yes gene_type:complete